MGQSRFDKGRHLDGVVMQKLFQGAHRRQDFRNWRRNISCVSWPSAANPILGSPKFTRIFVSTSHFVKQDSVDFLDEPKAKRQLLEPVQSMLHRFDIV